MHRYSWGEWEKQGLTRLLKKAKNGSSHLSHCLLAQACLTLCNPMDWGILEWVVISSSGASWPRDRSCISYISYSAGGFSACWAISREVHPAPIFTSLLQHWKKNCFIPSEMVCLTWQTSEESIFFQKCGILSSRAQCDSQYCSQPAEAVPSQGSDGGRAGAENLTYDFWLGYRLTRKCESKIILCPTIRFASLENDHIILQNLMQCWEAGQIFSFRLFFIWKKALTFDSSIPVLQGISS